MPSDHHQPEGRDAVLRRLKSYAKVRTTKGTIQDFGVACAKETDRGTIILVASFIEDQLVLEILRKMVPLNSEQHDRLFGPDAPIGTFAAKIKMAHALGIADRDTAKKLDALRELRNACAHSRQAISFETPELRNALRLLANRPHEPLPGEEEPSACRLALVMFSATLLGRITGLAEEEIREQLISALTEVWGPPPGAGLSPPSGGKRGEPHPPEDR